jgi:hypothetical protein
VQHLYYSEVMDPQRSPSRYFTKASKPQRVAANHLISIRLSDELIRRLAQVGNDEGLAMSDTIRLVLERGLASTPRKKTK